METEKKLTGYPSIDKPWLKYYSQEVINSTIPEMTAYQYAFECSKNNMLDCCFEYFGNRITYKDFFIQVQKVASSFQKLDIHKGDIVTIMSMHTPEALISIYALNYLGAIANMVYMTVSEQEIISSIKNTNSKALIALDIVIEKIINIKDSITIPIILLSVSDSMPNAMRLVYSMKTKTPKTDFISFRTLLKNKNINIEMCTDSTATAIIVYTSGTTGSPKGVMLSNYCLNSIAFSCQFTGKNYKRGEKFLSSIPPFLGFGITMTHLGLCIGFTSQIVLSPDPDEIAKTFLKLKSNRLVYGPRLTESIMKYVSVDLDFLVEFTGGGEAISLDQEIKINDFLEQHSAKTKYTTGYGMSEAGSVVTLNANNVNKIGSAGIPLPYVNVKIVDSGTEQKYNEIGEICFDSPSVMQGYYKNPEATSQVLEESDGRVWLHTGDLGYVDEDGFIFITGRLKRIFTILGKDKNMYKLFPQRIEEYICSIENVVSCAVVVKAHKEKLHSAIAFVALTQKSHNVDNIVSEIYKSIETNLPEHLTPDKIHIIDSILLTSSGKIDYRALEKMAEEM